MKSWMKFFAMAVVLLAVAFVGFAFGLKWTSPLGATPLGFICYLVIALVSVAATLFGLCILYELGRMWYQGSSLNTSWAADAYRRFKTWLGRDGLK